MKIDIDTLEKQKDMAGRHGGAVMSLLGLGGTLDDLPLFHLERGLLGGSGEVFGQDRHVNFKSDKGFSKLKDSRTVEYGSITDLDHVGAASWQRWVFRSPSGPIELTLVCYGSHNGIDPGEHIWYDVDTFPARSGAFYRTIGAILGRTPLHSSFEDPAGVRSKIEDAVSAFESSDRLSSGSISQPDVYAPWTALYNSFCTFLGGAASAGTSSIEAWTDLFLRLDAFYGRIVRRFRTEIENLGGAGLLGRESAILSLSDQFDRLSAIWYLRQILRLHLAEKHLPEDRIRHWTLKLLKPRARRYSNELKIQLPAPSEFDEQLAELER